MKTVSVRCLYCDREVEMLEVKGLRYVRWPVIHNKCFELPGKKKQKEVSNK